MKEHGRLRITASGDRWVVRWGWLGLKDCETGDMHKNYIVKGLWYPMVS